jgi:hypothetical protein
MRPLVLILCLLLFACGNLQNLAAKARSKRRAKALDKLGEAATQEASNRLGEKAAGEVVYVDAEGGYALVRARNGLPLPTGEELECQSPGNGRLKVTPERKNMFYAADILSGGPQKGDSVIAVKSKIKAGPKLVPIVATAPPGSNAPANTLNVDPSSIRPEDLPHTTLDEPRTPPRRDPARSPASDPGNLLLPPPLAPPELPQ